MLVKRLRFPELASTMYFLNHDHRIVTRIVGATGLAGFEHGLEQALAAP